VQVGQWQRSGPHWRDAVAFVRSGALGNIRTVKTWAYQGWMEPVPIRPDGPVPEGVDYDRWLGPAVSRPFNPNRFHFNFRWFWDYAGGLMTDWGVHILDFALFGMDAGWPRSVMASGGKFAYPDDASETPDTLQAIFEFDGFTLLWDHATGIDLGPYGRTHGVAFVGNNGTLIVDRGGWEVIAETEDDDRGGRRPKVEIPQPERYDGSDLDRHTQNFTAAIRTGEALNADISVGHRVATIAHMGNVAFRVGRKLHWDAEVHAFPGDDEAARLAVGNPYRAPWSLPTF
jgi:predicted dehydrogenase